MILYGDRNGTWKITYRGLIVVTINFLDDS